MRILNEDGVVFGLLIKNKASALKELAKENGAKVYFHGDDDWEISESPKWYGSTTYKVEAPDKPKVRDMTFEEIEALVLSETWFLNNGVKAKILEVYPHNRQFYVREKWATLDFILKYLTRLDGSKLEVEV